MYSISLSLAPFPGNQSGLFSSFSIMNLYVAMDYHVIHGPFEEQVGKRLYAEEISTVILAIHNVTARMFHMHGIRYSTHFLRRRSRQAVVKFPNNIEQQYRNPIPSPVANQDWNYTDCLFLLLYNCSHKRGAAQELG